MITIDDYKNQSTNPYLVKGFVENISTEVQIRKQLSDNLSKGLIDQEVHDKAIDQLENLLVKGGVGSGRHKVGDIVTGKTPNGSTFIGKIHRELIGGKRFRVYYDGGGDGVYDDHELEKHTENVKSGEGSHGGHVIGQAHNLSGGTSSYGR